MFTKKKKTPKTESKLRNGNIYSRETNFCIIYALNSLCLVSSNKLQANKIISNRICANKQIREKNVHRMFFFEMQKKN